MQVESPFASVRALLKFGAFCLAALFFVSCIARQGREAGSPPQVAARPQQPESVQVAEKAAVSGAQGYLQIPTLDEVWVCRTKDAHSKMVRAIRIDDNHGIRELITSGDLFITPARTKCLILQSGFMTNEVRLLDGPHSGRSGIVTAEWVHVQ